MRKRSFHHKYRVRAPLYRVIDLFYSPAALAKLTPPPLSVVFRKLPPRIEEQAIMEMDIGLGHWRLSWTACFTEVGNAHFIDEQLEGPFSSWVHTHTFRAINQDTTEISDRIELILGQGFRHRILSLFFWMGLPFLFAFRRLRTQSLL